MAKKTVKSQKTCCKLFENDEMEGINIFMENKSIMGIESVNGGSKTYLAIYWVE